MTQKDRGFVVKILRAFCGKKLTAASPTALLFQIRMML
jgi:hypothetical protein